MQSNNIWNDIFTYTNIYNDVKLDFIFYSFIVGNQT